MSVIQSVIHPLCPDVKLSFSILTRLSHSLPLILIGHYDSKDTRLFP